MRRIERSRLTSSGRLSAGLIVSLLLCTSAFAQAVSTDSIGGTFRTSEAVLRGHDFGRVTALAGGTAPRVIQLGAKCQF